MAILGVSNHTLFRLDSWSYHIPLVRGIVFNQLDAPCSLDSSDLDNVIFS